MAFSLGEYQDLFLEEADEQLQELNQNLLELEKNPDDIDIINNIFRAAHSLKSSAAFVGLYDLSDLAHKMENLLQGIRDRTMNVTPEIVDVIFKCFDEINGVIDAVAAGEEPTQDLTWIIDRIKAVSEKSGESEGPEGSEVTSGEKDNLEIPALSITSQELKAIKEGIGKNKSCSEITVYIEKNAQMKWVKAQLVLNNLGRIGDIVTTIPPAEDLSDDDMSNVFKVVLLSQKNINDIKNACDIDLVIRIDVKSISITKKDNKSALKFGAVETFMVGEQTTVDASKSTPTGMGKEEVAAGYVVDEEDEHETDEIHDLKTSEADRRKVPGLRTVKVSVDKLDQLLNNVGELVIANSGFYKLYEELRKFDDVKGLSNEFKNRMEQMSRIAKDLQTGIMKTRMVPIGQVFSRFNRLVRDLAKEFSKNIELIIKGEETELDKKVIDSIGEPLMHLIRNAIDHGIETADDRKKLGKSEVAYVTLNAYQGGNQIFVEVSDDGKGLNADVIKRKAIEKELSTPEIIASMDNTDIYNFIFAPGFSTATKITDVSGRGVGMNVVREIVNELNGNVSIETELGMGTRFVLAFPLTLAIIPAIMVKVRQEMYAIPLSDVIETIKIAESDITTIEGHEVINLRGEILSLLRLNEFVGIRSALTKDQKAPVVVVGYGNRKIGLIVDYLEGKQEIVIKSLEQNYRTVEGLAGASILGDGSICLILDISSMINKVITDQDRLKKFKRDAFVAEESSFEEVTVKDYEAPQKEPKVSTPAFIEKDPGSSGERYTSGPERKKDKSFKQKTDESPREEFLYEKADSSQLPESIEDEIVQPEIKEPEILSEKLEEEPQEIMIEDDEVKQKVHDALQDFKKELKENVKTAVQGGSTSDHIKAMLDIDKEDIDEFQLIANIGATQSAESLSKILDKRIDLSIPEVTVKPVEKIPEFLGDIENTYIGVMLPIMGDAKGTLLFILKDDVGFNLIDMLYGTTTRETNEMNEDGESALKELTNIIGSSVINVFSEKTGLVIKPSVPTIVHDYLQSVIDSILVMHNMTNDYAIIMDTAFYFEDDSIIGNLLVLPEADSMKNIVNKLRSHVG